MMDLPSLPSPRAVIFDLDGTLTEPVLDFDLMRAEIGLPERVPILEQLESLTLAARARAEEILLRHERAAIAQATLADGCADLLGHLRGRAIPIAILTRNVREVVETFARMFTFEFHAVYTREDGPAKPSPVGALALCRAMGVDPTHTLAVGDYKYDVMAGRDAGCRTALVRSAPLAEHERADWGSPDLVVKSLRELLPLFTR
jgi:HAD superfamily hydrolase (TIGR01549 family)